MGRPLDEKFMGDFSNLGSQFTVQCFIKGDTRRNTGFILRQKNSRKFEKITKFLQKFTFVLDFDASEPSKTMKNLRKINVF